MMLLRPRLEPRLPLDNTESETLTSVRTGRGAGATFTILNKTERRGVFLPLPLENFQSSLDEKTPVAVMVSLQTTPL